MLGIDVYPTFQLSAWIIKNFPDSLKTRKQVMYLFTFNKGTFGNWLEKQLQASLQANYAQNLCANSKLCTDCGRNFKFSQLILEGGLHVVCGAAVTSL